jgi:Protein of unknown function (DUF3224)
MCGRGWPSRAEEIHRCEREFVMKIKAVLAALPVLAFLVMLPSGASASISSSGSGSFTAVGEIISVRQADGNTIVTATEVQTLTGALTGTRVASGTMIFHPDGTFTAHDTGTFTGTIDGRTGSITISGASSGAGTTGTGQLVGDHGTGGLAGLHLQGTFAPAVTGPTSADGTYSIRFHFAS